MVDPWCLPDDAELPCEAREQRIHWADRPPLWRHASASKGCPASLGVLPCRQSNKRHSRGRPLMRAPMPDAVQCTVRSTGCPCARRPLHRFQQLSAGLPSHAVDDHANVALFRRPMSLHPRALPAGFIAPCLPTSAPQPPSGALWLHEIKHDGFRVIARKNGTQVRLYSRPGNDLTYRFPLIVESLSVARALMHSRRRGCRLR